MNPLKSNANPASTKPPTPAPGAAATALQGKHEPPQSAVAKPPEPGAPKPPENPAANTPKPREGEPSTSQANEQSVLDNVRAEIKTRLAELEPVISEFKRLTQALEALDGPPRPRRGRPPKNA